MSSTGQADPMERMSPTAATDNKDGKNEKKKKKGKDDQPPMASIGEVLSFIDSRQSKFLFGMGVFTGILNGLVYPALAYIFSTSFSNLSGAADGMQAIREVAYTFLIVGAYGCVVATLQTGCLEAASKKATLSFRTQWFAALLRQDTAFFDITDVGGTASIIAPNARKLRRGLGRQLGQGIQFGTTFVGGIAYAFYANWKVSLVILAVTPIASLSALAALKVNQSKSSNAAKAYAHAGSIAYSTVSSIRTVLSLNAIPEMIRQYSKATLEAYKHGIKGLWKEGLANGSLMGSFIFLYCILTLFGSYLLYDEIRNNGCDPSDSVDGNSSCNPSASDVFGAMLGVAFAGQGLSQVANFGETFAAARSAVYPATIAINRKVGAEEQEAVIGAPQDQKKAGTELAAAGGDVEEGQNTVKKVVLPKYVIDSSSSAGAKPENARGAISFKHVSFSYPTRPDNPIFSDFCLDIEPGTTVALVGPSGGGKSTTVALIERFYDPLSGSVSLDGVDLKEFNVKHLRSQIGYVGQEPVLFATTIAGNIKYGNPNATQDQIEEAAKMANAHDFIMSFPDGYNTQVGDKGAQLSGGQKQRVAIARVLVSNPKILILDEATSALDSESERVVQEALDKLLTGHKRTTVVIAHRLSTIQNADVIAVVMGGKVVEKGHHDELMEASTGHYRRLVEKQDQEPTDGPPSRSSSMANLNEESTKSLSAVVAENGTDKISFSTSYQLTFKGVKFAYPTRPEKAVFKGFNLSVRKGETLALVGPSGGGKSTTVSMIERFYDPQEGVVEYEGLDLKLLNVKWLRDQIGYVGQEPTLFNTTIGRNIAYGFEGATQNDIEEAARMANAHDFIMSFPKGYDTEVGEGGAQLSGGQKQRVAIARALVKKPKILLLDEATSALDSESEGIVQEALDKLMESRGQTTIVIAHRLSTIRNADRIAFIADGVVKELGTHDELMEKPKGRYKRLVESQKRGSSLDLKALEEDAGKGKHATADEEEGEDRPDFKKEIEEEASQSFDAKRARALAKPDVKYFLFGGIGTVLAGGVYPAWGIVFALMIKLLFRRVYDCPAEEGEFDPLVAFGFESCDEYWDDISDDMRKTSFELTGYWFAICFGCLVGFTLMFWGFGMASERMNRRVRDSAFRALVRQEISFFDKRSVGFVTSQLQDDAARIHTFSGEPIRTLILNVSSVVTGVIISLIFMWPFALLAMATIPFMGFATEVEMKTFIGADEGDDNQEGKNSPSGIVVETLLNMRTVSALNMQKERYNDYINALKKEEPNYVMNSFKSGATSGLSMLVQQWVNGFMFWWGGWILFNYPDIFSFQDFLISMFALLFSLFGLGAASANTSDRKECEKSAGRIFYLLNRQSAIDPLSEDGKKLD